MEFIHRFNPGANGRTLLLLHGTGGTEDDLLPWAELVDPSAGVLSVRGKVLEGSMPRFFKRFPDGSFDLDDLRFRVRELADFVVEACGDYEIEQSSLYALGYSNGANTAAALLLLRPETISGGILVRAMMPVEPDVQPDLTGKHVLILAGQSDPYAPAERVERLEAALQSYGADAQVAWRNGGHEVSRAELEAASEWISLLD